MSARRLQGRGPPALGFDAAGYSLCTGLAGLLVIVTAIVLYVRRRRHLIRGHSGAAPATAYRARPAAASARSTEAQSASSMMPHAARAPPAQPATSPSGQ